MTDDHGQDHDHDHEFSGVPAQPAPRFLLLLLETSGECDEFASIGQLQTVVVVTVIVGDDRLVSEQGNGIPVEEQPQISTEGWVLLVQRAADAAELRG